jgi:hypothetical protein
MQDVVNLRHQAISAAMKGIKLTEDEVVLVNNLSSSQNLRSSGRLR